ncbi:hypothetical protein Acor_15900 [Acrocarpospora corrugata]|uniref:Uncharacterized protein n=1 Tax=Acrocarpospora corrugata TaxID=35763 RepID=A0A5M3VRW7_9ACTN|nr:hypothetical protein [Acrocarpospora corrugata]GER99526.1 hypothetical protein Acor_15900 [Acrocarpospora corrugata]
MPARTPDGRTLTVEGSPQPFTMGWSYMVWARGDGGSLRFHTAAAGARELISRHLGEYGRFTVREVSWNGARLVSHEDPENGGTTMLWIGPHHEVYTFIPGVNVPFEAFMGHLAGFDIQDAPDGVVLAPRLGARVRLGNMLAVNTLDGVCSVQVNPVGDLPRPGGTGKRVRGGALWKLDERRADGRVLRSAIVVNETTTTTLIAREADDPRFAAVADSITCGLN